MVTKKAEAEKEAFWNCSKCGASFGKRGKCNICGNWLKKEPRPKSYDIGFNSAISQAEAIIDEITIKKQVFDSPTDLTGKIRFIVYYDELNSELQKLRKRGDGE